MIRLPIEDVSHVAEARRHCVALAKTLDFDETSVGRVALIVTELATNLIKHTSGGEILAGPEELIDGAGLQIYAVDSGPGMGNSAQCLGDGFSTAGSSGTGLGAIGRLAQEFELSTQPGTGTVIYARIASGRVGHSVVPRHLHSVISVPKPGELVNGDAWAVVGHATRPYYMVVDGLGHGAEAAEAAKVAVQVFTSTAADMPGTMLTRIHHELRATRGAAVSIAAVQADKVVYAGIGNIAGAIVTGTSVRKMVTLNGTAGMQVRRVQEFEYPFSADSTLVLHSDGLSANWTLDNYPGLSGRHTGVIAGVLYRDCVRRRDDATVLVARRSPT